MFYTYVLQNKKNKEFYIGFTSNLKSRLLEHNQGLNFSAKRYMPWKLVYYEACIEESDARRREKYLKTTQGGRLPKRRIKDYLYNERKI
ncbi:GIY-YIG nuclease family protein [Candidatus Roizmanbacteria bacterium]|nr:GIY-YIG nuclease family protein [Candidatus Roizmanbacteria bacterium]